ncbi:hypothetical protein [Hymenobacter sp. UYP22]|uniref:hypothetical protein n=1 Tax=Hymenobacter sp. UYP22 TaxID=3156348 RepID=UPI003398FF56
MNNTSPLFKELDGNTLFTAQQFWEYTVDTTGEKQLRECVGAWAWENVWSVQTMSEQSCPEVEGPRCAVHHLGEWLWIRAEYQTVLTSWRNYRKRYQNRFQFTTPS